MDTGVFCGMIFSCGAAQSYTFAFQQATLYWARRLAGLPTEDELTARGVANGESERTARIRADAEIQAWQMTEGAAVQSSLTPREQTARQVMVILCTGATVLCGWVCFDWYIGLASLFAIYAVSGLAARWMPSRDGSHYTLAIHKHLHSQYVTYHLQGNTNKANAAMYLLNAMSEAASIASSGNHYDSTKQTRIGHMADLGATTQMATDVSNTAKHTRDTFTIQTFFVYATLLVATLSAVIITYREIRASQAYSTGSLGH